MESIAKISTKWVWDEFGKEIALGIAGELKHKWDEFQWKDAEILYRKRLIEIYGIVKLLGNPKAIDLQSIYTDVYALDKLSAFHRYDINSLLEHPERDLILNKEKRKSILRIAANAESLFILGKPGAGKTTFLKFIAIQACLGKIEYTPIFVSLKEWKDSGLLLDDFIIKQFEICKFPNSGAFVSKLLETGKALVLFDGLDEVNETDNLRQQTIQELVRFRRRNPNNKIFITCRIAAVDFSFDNFTYLEIADFDKRQIRSFAEKWYQGFLPKFSLFIQQLEKPENKGFLELARTPLLLALFCLAFDETMAFPEKRVDLYKEAIDALLKKWDSTRGIYRGTIYKSLSSVRKEHLLSKIAADNFALNKYFIKQNDIERQIQEYIEQLPGYEMNQDIPDSEQILKAIEAQHGILVERAKNIYSFSHLTFQEYLTAKFIVENAAQSTIVKLILDYDIDTRWHEIVLLVSNIMSNAEPLLFLLRKTSSQHFTHNTIELFNSIESNIYQVQLEKGLGRLTILLIALITSHHINKAKIKNLWVYSLKNKVEIEKVNKLISDTKNTFYLGLELLPTLEKQSDNSKKISSILSHMFDAEIKIENMPSTFSPFLGFDISNTFANYGLAAG